MEKVKENEKVKGQGKNVEMLTCMERSCHK